MRRLRCVVVGEVLGDNRSMIGRHFEEIYIMISAEGHLMIWRQSADDRQTSVDDIYQRTTGRHSPDIGRHSADDRPTVGRS